MCAPHHLWQKLSGRIRLLECLLRKTKQTEIHSLQASNNACLVKKTCQIKQQELLDGMVVRGQHVSDDGDEKLGQLLSVQDSHDSLLHCGDLRLGVVSLESFLDLGKARRFVIMNQKRAISLADGGHGSKSLNKEDLWSTR